MIYTNLTPEIINIYKGSFNNELLTVSGGYMNYKKYANSPEIIKEFGHALDTSEYSEKELETAEIYYDLPVIIVATKADKIPRGKWNKHESVIKKALNFDKQDDFIIFSSETKEGKEAAWTAIEKFL